MATYLLKVENELWNQFKATLPIVDKEKNRKRSINDTLVELIKLRIGVYNGKLIIRPNTTNKIEG